VTTRLYKEDSSNQTIDLVVGEKIEIRLPENPTTGFRWHRTTDDLEYCKLVSETFAAPAGPPGHGGEHSWIFAAVRPGECDIVLQYRRGWVPSIQPARRFKIHVRVEDPARGKASP